MAIPNGSFVRCTFRGILTGQQVEVTMVYRATSLLSFADVAPAHTAVATLWGSNFLNVVRDVQATSFTWTEIMTQVYTPETTYVPTKTIIGTIGTAASAALPSEVAFVTTKTSPLAGKRNRGRMYWPGLTIEGISTVNGRWVLGVTDIMEPLAVAIGSTPIIPAGTTPPLNPCVTNGDLTLYTLTTGGGVNVSPRSQRRRQIGRGV